MKLAVFCVMLILSINAVSDRRVHTMTTQEINKINALRGDQSWSSIIIGLAELHMMSQGPIESLIEAIQNVVQDLEVKLEAAQNEFDKRSSENRETLRRIQGEIDEANSDIANTQAFLNDVLLPQKMSLEEDITRYRQTIENNKKYIEDATIIRKSEHDKFVGISQEHADAIAALDECLALVGQLAEGNTSLVQVNKAKTSLQKIQRKLNKNVESTFIKALIQLTMSDLEFADQDKLQQVTELLFKVKENLTFSMNEATRLENEQQAFFEQECKDRSRNNDEMMNNITEATKQLEHLENTILDKQNFIAFRQHDLIVFNSEMEEENKSFDLATKTFEDLTNQFNKELEACQAALDIVQNADFSGYITNRVGMDKVIDTAKVSNVSVN